ncbi:hypothetical protein [Rhizobium glycinendophyticum]|uniref:Uncharacterized protein n=1 Tax=Rhizobium glycinendophyticum TaxID=2589807 RepID=A0A504UEL4_9HYPH|nr:hypothetical protein [Rhizobium glycinendophyticum]TPP03942.1 hypothetical protein FJQ55_22915 [Rhizobium glycinendophyticum]
MISAARSTGAWPLVEPVKGTLADVLRIAWKKREGWHSIVTGTLMYARAKGLVDFVGADLPAEDLTEEALASYLDRQNDITTYRAVLQLLETASQSKMVTWRPVRRLGAGDLSPIALRRPPAGTALFKENWHDQTDSSP